MFDDAVDITHAGKAQAGPDIRHLIFVTNIDDVIFPDSTLLLLAINTKPAHATRSLGDLRVRGINHKHTTVAGGDVLNRLERIHGVAGPMRHWPATPAQTERMRPILDDRNIILLLKPAELIQVTG